MSVVFDVLVCLCPIKNSIAVTQCLVPCQKYPFAFVTIVHLSFLCLLFPMPVHSKLAKLALHFTTLSFQNCSHLNLYKSHIHVTYFALLITHLYHNHSRLPCLLTVISFCHTALFHTNTFTYTSTPPTVHPLSSLLYPLLLLSSAPSAPVTTLTPPPPFFLSVSLSVFLFPPAPSPLHLPYLSRPLISGRQGDRPGAPPPACQQPVHGGREPAQAVLYLLDGSDATGHGLTASSTPGAGADQ